MSEDPGLRTMAGAAMAIALLVGVGCASSSSPAGASALQPAPETNKPAPAESTGSDVASGEDSGAEDSGVTFARTESADSSGDTEPGHGPPLGLMEGDSAETETVASSSAARDSSSRPRWWVDDAIIEDGRILISAEALGRDVLTARRAAVDAGFDRLETAVQGEVLDERVIYTVVEPLPARSASRTGNRYVGYVLMSAVAPTSE